MRDLDQMRRDCKNSWITPYIGLVKRFAYYAGHLQRGAVGKRPSTHGFRPWDVGAAAAVAFPGQLFGKTPCRLTERQGARIIVKDGDVDCDSAANSGPVVRVLTDLAPAQFIAVMVNALCHDPS